MGRITLNDVLSDPGRARALPRLVRSALLAQCAAVIVALSSTDDAAEARSDLQPPTPPPDADRLLKAGEVAGLLGLKRAYIYELARNKTLRSIKTGKYIRFSRADIADFKATHSGLSAVVSRDLSSVGIRPSVYGSDAHSTKAKPPRTGAQTNGVGRPPRGLPDHGQPLGVRYLPHPQGG